MKNRSLSIKKKCHRSFAQTKGQRSKRQPTHSLRRSAYPHQPCVGTLYVLPPRRRPKLVLTGTSIPLFVEYTGSDRKLELGYKVGERSLR